VFKSNNNKLYQTPEQKDELSFSTAFGFPEALSIPPAFSFSPAFGIPPAFSVSGTPLSLSLSLSLKG
jgi:hypothetical protein